VFLLVNLQSADYLDVFFVAAHKPTASRCKGLIGFISGYDREAGSAFD
jgi:hypothetical protein